jgi:3-oxoadipate enol-lactonase
MAVLVDDLRQVVDTAAAGGALVIGESFGGALALSFSLAHPERVRGLVVLNSFPYFSPQFRLHAGLWALRSMPWGAMPLVRRLTAARLHSGHTHRTEIRRFMELTARTTREGYMNRLRILTRYDVRERLTQLNRPTLFLASEKDHLVPAVRQARFMASRVPGAVVRILGGHGHICLIAPDIDLAQILDEWTAARNGPVE